MYIIYIYIYGERIIVTIRYYLHPFRRFRKLQASWMDNLAFPPVEIQSTLESTRRIDRGGDERWGNMLDRCEIRVSFGRKWSSGGIYFRRYSWSFVLDFSEIYIYFIIMKEEITREKGESVFANSLKQNFITHSLGWKYYNIIEEIKRYEEKVKLFLLMLIILWFF